MKDPAVLFYTGDFLNGCVDLTFEERGQYITLLCLQHRKGHLSEKTIRLTVGSVSDDVLTKFAVDEEGNYFHHRMEEEIEKRAQFIETRRINGKLGGRPIKPTATATAKANEKLIEDEDRIEVDYKGVVDKFHSLCPEFSKVMVISDVRKSHIKARIKEHGEDKLFEVFSIASGSNFLNGKNDRGWSADFDWLLNPNNFIKVMEGKYKNTGPHKKSVQELKDDTKYGY